MRPLQIEIGGRDRDSSKWGYIELGFVYERTKYLVTKTIVNFFFTLHPF